MKVEYKIRMSLSVRNRWFDFKGSGDLDELIAWREDMGRRGFRDLYIFARINQESRYIPLAILKQRNP